MKPPFLRVKQLLRSAFGVIGIEISAGIGWLPHFQHFFESDHLLAGFIRINDQAYRVLTREFEGF
jgi:hypothetical protein